MATMIKTDSLATLKKIVSKQITDIKIRLQYLQQDAESGENVDDTILRTKLRERQDFYLKHFGEVC